MKGKSKKFLSLLTATAVIITSIPSVFAGNNVSANSSRTITGITANYSGGEQYVGSFINADDVTISVNYSDGTSENVGSNCTVKNASNTPQVTNEKDNPFTVSYKDKNTGVSYSTTLNVWGYKEKGIEAEYVGSDVLVGNQFASKDVNVSLVYTEHQDGSEHKDALAQDQYTLVNSNNQPNPTVTATGWNDYTITYQGRTESFNTGIKVWGYKFDSVTATYKGKDILVGSNYLKSDVEVKHNYTPYHDGTVKTDVVSDFSVNDTKVNSTGANTYTATTNLGSANFVVTGYEKAPITIEHITAQYTGKDIRVGGYVNANDVSITVYYSDGSSANVGSNCTVKGVSSVAPAITKTGYNDFIAVYDGKYEAKLQVWGYDVDRIEATYNGPSILTQTNYNKSDVSVTAYWTERKDGTNEAYIPKTFDVNSTLVTVVGNNSFTATAEGKQANFVVPGYDDRLYVDHISAEYVGNDILVGSNYSKSDVKVTIHYTNGTSKETEDFTVNSTKVSNTNYNKYTVTSNNKTADIQVWGYKPESIEAKYVGPDILVGTQFASKNVNVTLIYTPYHDGTIRKDTLAQDQYTLVNSANKPNPTVTTTGWNKYTVTYNNMNAQIQVWGYKLSHIKANYTGSDIRINENYNKSDVSVTAYWTERKDGTSQSFAVKNNEFTVNSTLVEKEGENTYTATYKELTDDFNVNGFDDNVYVSSITAKYVGPDILVNSDYSKSDVQVTVSYTDGSTRTITDGFDVSSLTVKTIGYNTYKVTYQEKTADIQVWGYKPESIKAEYVGPDVLVGNMFASKDVTVVLTYTPNSDGSVRKDTLAQDQYTLVNSANKPNPTVTTTGWNDYTVNYQGLTDGIKVWGYKAIKINAEYTGPNIFVGDVFASKDVTVKLIYTPYHDGTTKEENIDVKNCNIKNVLGQAGYKVLTKGNNTYTVTYKELSDTIDVWGYNVDHIKAAYNGPDIRINENYDKANVSVEAFYSTRTDNGVTSFIVNNNEFTVNSTLVEKIGLNSYTATYKGLTDDFNVNGFDDGVYVKYIKAEYVGPDILVGNTFKSSDVVVNVYYTDGTSKTVSDGYEITPFKENVGPVVNDLKWNTYTVTYEGMTDDIRVWGYKPESIDAEYVGPDILVGNMFASKDVNVTLIYTPYHDGTVRKDDLAKDQYTLTNALGLPNPTVTDVEWNDYTVNYQGLTDGIKVWGYKLKDLTAVYNGPDIYIGNEYNKADVTVTATFTPYHDGTNKVVNVENFDVDSLVVPVLGPNVYTASCEYGKAPFTVIGINKPIEKTENIFNIVAVDKNGNNVKDVTVDYSTNGFVGTLKTGDVTTAKLGVDTVITTKDCTISVPEEYEIDKTQMAEVKTESNTTYTLTIVLKDANKPIEKTENTINLVAVDKDGNEIKDVSMKYSTNGFVGTLKTGDIVTAKLGIDTVITLDDCTISVPDGYEISKTQMTEVKTESNTVYTVTVVLNKSIPVIEKTENTINLVAVDKDGNEVKDVSMKYSTNGFVGTLKTGDVVTAKLGIGTIVTLDDCTITVPDGYEISKTQLDISNSAENTKYTVLVVVNKKEETVERTENLIKLVAVDKDGNEIKDVEMRYSVGDYKGILKSGYVTTAKLGVDTMMTAENCAVGIPTDYTLSSKDFTSVDNGTYVEYTLKVVLEKAAKDEPKKDPTPTDNNKPNNDNPNNDKPNENTTNEDTTVDIPQTGDESNVMLYVVFGGAALIALFTLLITKKKEEN